MIVLFPCVDTTTLGGEIYRHLFFPAEETEFCEWGWFQFPPFLIFVPPLSASETLAVIILSAFIPMIGGMESLPTVTQMPGGTDWRMHLEWPGKFTSRKCSYGNVHGPWGSTCLN